MYNFCCSLKIVDITDEVTQSSDIEMDNVVVDEVNAKKLNKDTRVSRTCTGCPIWIGPIIDTRQIL